MKTKSFVLMSCALIVSAPVFADSVADVPKGKVSFTLYIPKSSAEKLKAGQHLSVQVDNGQKGKYDPAPVIQGSLVLDGLILQVGTYIKRDGYVGLVLAVTPKEAQKLKDAQAQRAQFTLELLSSN